MHEISAVALFCDDIREEKIGTHSLIGIWGDNIGVPGFPGALPKLAIYVRIHVPVDLQPEKFELFFNLPGGERILANTVDRKLINRTIKDAKKAGNPIAGIYSVMIASPFPVAQAGRIAVEMEWAEGKKFLGSLNFIDSGNGPSGTSE